MTQTPTEVKKGGGMNKKILLAIIIVVVILAIPAVPQSYKVTENQSKTESYVEQEPYTVDQTVTVSEPYTETQWVTVQQPVQVQQPFSTTILDTTISVAASHAQPYSYAIDLTDTSNNRIYGSVVETAGYGISFLVFDQQGYTAWKANQNNGNPYVKYTDQKSISFSFVPTHTDTYYFILDNQFSWFTNKLPHLVVNWSGSKTVTEMQSVQQQQQVTKYHDVQKTQTVTLYRDVTKTRVVTAPVEVTKTRYMSLLQLFTGG